MTKLDMTQIEKYRRRQDKIANRLLDIVHKMIERRQQFIPKQTRKPVRIKF